MKLKLYSFISALLICSNMLANNEPWQNPQVNEINREPMHAHFIPFTNEANALKQHSLPADVRFNVNPATERRISLDGTWKFLFSKNNELCPKDFHKPGYNTRKWSKNTSSRKLGVARLRCTYLYGYPLSIPCQSPACASRLQSGGSIHPRIHGSRRLGRYGYLPRL